jgi:hypothetical protein
VIHQEPPTVLVLKRKWIRLFPHGEKIAVYRNDKLGVNFAVPYDEKEPIEASATIGAVSEGARFDRAAGAIFGLLKKKGKLKTPPLDDAAREFMDANPVNVDLNMKKQWHSVAGAAAGAVVAGYAANKLGKKLRKKLDQPNEKKLRGEPVYQAEAAPYMFPPGVSPRPAVSYYRASAKTFAKLGAVSGLAFGASKTAYDVASDFLKKKKKKKKKEKLQENPIAMAYVSHKGSQASDQVQKAGRKAVRYIKKKLTREEVEQLQEIVPAIAAAARFVVPAAARLMATRGAVGAVKAGSALMKGGGTAGSLGRTAVGHVGIGAGLSGVERAVVKKPTRLPMETPKEDEADTVDEGAQMATRPHQEVRKKLHIPKGTGKEMVKAGAVALATVGVQKIFDYGYDKWRDKKQADIDAKAAAKVARARANAAPKKVITRKIVKPHETVTIKKELIGKKAIRETAFDEIQKISQGQHGKVKHDNGMLTAVDSFTAKAIMNIHQHLSEPNKQKLVAMVNRDRAGLTKIADFAFRQHNS